LILSKINNILSKWKTKLFEPVYSSEHKVVFKFYKSIVTQTVAGGLTMYPLVAIFCSEHMANIMQIC